MGEDFMNQGCIAAIRLCLRRSFHRSEIRIGKSETGLIILKQFKPGAPDRSTKGMFLNNVEASAMLSRITDAEVSDTTEGDSSNIAQSNSPQY